MEAEAAEMCEQNTRNMGTNYTEKESQKPEKDFS